MTPPVSQASKAGLPPRFLRSQHHPGGGGGGFETRRDSVSHSHNSSSSDWSWRGGGGQQESLPLASSTRKQVRPQLNLIGSRDATHLANCVSKPHEKKSLTKCGLVRCSDFSPEFNFYDQTKLASILWIWKFRSQKLLSVLDNEFRLKNH